MVCQDLDPLDLFLLQRTYNLPLRNGGLNILFLGFDFFTHGLNL
jgi:hypothetical protein